MTTYIIKKYNLIEFQYPIDYLKYTNINFAHLHLSLDTPEDYELLKNIFQQVYLKKNHFHIEDVLDYLEKSVF